MSVNDHLSSRGSSISVGNKLKFYSNLQATQGSWSILRPFQEG